MKIKSIEYEEFADSPNYWKLEKCEFEKINLIVGQNSTGKSRTISILNGLSQILSGKHTTAFNSGTHNLVIEDNKKDYVYTLKCDKSKVTEEKLTINGDVKLVRQEDGTGSVHYDELGTKLKFKSPTNVIAITQHNDEIQNAYLLDLIRWTSRTEYIQFGTSLHRDHLIAVEDASEKDNFVLSNIPQEHILNIYVRGYNEFGAEFDKKIINDMRQLGYFLTDVGSQPINVMINGRTNLLLAIYVKEEGLDFQNYQQTMSQGMFRALSLIIKLNYLSLKNIAAPLLVDDIGEGLDFLRSKALIKLIIEKFQDFDGQLIMTSNDQFIMDEVPLEYWTILRREKNVVRSYNIKNSMEKFSRFKLMGLNNFDLFSMEIFK